MTVQRHNNFYQTRSLFSIFAPMLNTRVFYWGRKMKLLLIGLLLLSSTAQAQLNVPYGYPKQYQQQPDWTQQNRDRQERQQRELDERWRQEREYQQRERQIQQERQFINGLRR